jgi:hypothetical protein
LSAGVPLTKPALAFSAFDLWMSQPCASVTWVQPERSSCRAYFASQQILLGCHKSFAVRDDPLPKLSQRNCSGLAVEEPDSQLRLQRAHGLCQRGL